MFHRTDHVRCSRSARTIAVAAGIATGLGMLAALAACTTDEPADETSAANADSTRSTETVHTAPGVPAAAQPVAAAPPAGDAAGERIPVRTVDDLPRLTYTLPGGALETLRDEAVMQRLADALMRDIAGILEKYDIQDQSTLASYYDTLGSVLVLKGDLRGAMGYSEKSRELATKEQDRLMSGVTLRARFEALEASGGDRARFERVFKQELADAVGAMPYELVKDRLIQVRNTAKIVSRELIESSTATGLDPIIEANGRVVPLGVAASLVSTYNTLDFGLDLIPLMAEVYGSIIDANAGAAVAADLWTPRLVELSPAEDADPVVVAIWDSGVDTDLYPGQLWTNAAETRNGADDDGNGFVDDLHGIAFDQDHAPTVGPLADISGLTGDLDTLMGYVAAAQDMQAGLMNEQVQAFMDHYSKLRDEQLRTFTDDLSLIGSYAHGTHVAGVAAAGNPFIRMMHVSENWPWKSIPDRAPTVEEGLAWGASAETAVAYMRANNVRVVNMSWRVGRSAFEAMLQAKGVGETSEERAALSREIYAGLRDGLERAIRSAPEILFIAGSGNEDNDVDFAEYVPAGLRLDNLITVGAIDNRDRFADFSSSGANVKLYANGYRIPSKVPGGRVIEFSGTSMASPQVANLAAKLLALAPELTPAEVVAVITENADPLPGQPGRLIINPAKTVEAVRSR